MKHRWLFTTHRIKMCPFCTDLSQRFLRKSKFVPATLLCDQFSHLTCNEINILQSNSSAWTAASSVAEPSFLSYTVCAATISYHPLCWRCISIYSCLSNARQACWSLCQTENQALKSCPPILPVHCRALFRFAPNIAVNALSKLHSEGNGFINLSSYFLCAMQDKQYKESH